MVGSSSVGVNVGILFILAVMAFVLPILVGVYVYRDARKRGMNGALWTLIAILAPSLIGFIIYLLVRENHPDLKCPCCEAAIKEQYAVCPKCGAKLRPSCPNCAAPVETDWTVCPKCAQTLPESQEDIVTPLRPKDTGLRRILVAVVAIPLIAIAILAVMMVAPTFFDDGGESSLYETSVETYFAGESVPSSAKDFVREWMENLPDQENQVYALCFEAQGLEGSKEKDYYYLVYLPVHSGMSNTGVGRSVDLFVLELETNGEEAGESFCCMKLSGRKKPPEIEVRLNGRSLESVVTVVDFNPTSYDNATEENDFVLKDAATEDASAE